MTAGRVTCQDCDIPLGLLRIGPKHLRLGHTREPHPIHPPRPLLNVRLTPAARNAVPAATELPEGPNSYEDGGPSPRSVARPSAGRTPSAGVGHDRAPSSSPAGKAHRRSGAAPRPLTPRLPRSASTL